ncbi:bifunctional helix-turn-helix transcriptional regulator/GNAT family N-acetyltransferase [Streptomyces litchfieldiae]|uniref:Helix-turn-helix domain-containing GNAT family N-acetyltransferase n=1 Tax=Streptomyces litchfieldiae TaxID=3075543 RepID=A0ABU2MSL3_9ACTN|nr:helix-turn-helix domain-containing GNAT family N-acetyltransferase [Streptomyces sp. DSM 44938]MDT0344632.1 helix-turn-helix domain-containing GNAT family N-acetyltransferase [Streptomyces sp. DSM 44938]
MNEIVARLRAFNRDYTRLIGALDYEHRLGTPHSLPEARVLYELARRERTPVTTLRQDLDMDPGQLSRLLTRAEQAGLVRRERDPDDSRRQLVRPTGAGRAAADLLDTRSTAATAALVEKLSPAERAHLDAALRTVSRLLGLTARPETFRLRAPGPGDLGWVIQRHGALYTAEYGWNAAFEALVAEVVARYAADHDPAREGAWIAEHDGEPVGSVFCVAEPGDPGTARLRLLLVEPHARGLGAGRALVARCVDFARETGHRRLVLWTNDVLTSARRIYEAAGFVLTRTRPHEMFGRPETGQEWELDLT